MLPFKSNFLSLVIGVCIGFAWISSPAYGKECESSVARLSKDYPTANFASCEVLAPNRFELTLKPEDEPINPSPWYGFAIHPKAGHTHNVQIALKYKVAPHRYAPKISVDRVNWVLLDESAIETVDEFNVVLSIPLQTSTVYVSAQPIRDSAFYAEWLSSVEKTYPSITRLTLGYSRGKQPIEALFLNASGNRVALLMSRSHPPEITGVYAYLAFVNELLELKNKACLDPQSAACTFFRRTGFLMVPVLNPDGVDRGYWRHTLGSKDLNRDWFDRTEPETNAVLDMVESLVEQGRKFAINLDFHSTNRDVFYTQTESDVTDPPSFATQWLKKAEELGVRSSPEHAPRELSDLGTSKNYFFRTYGSPSITYEVGDNTSQADAEHNARVFAHALVEVLGNQLAPLSPALSTTCEQYFCYMLDANAASLLNLVNQKLIDRNLASDIARSQLAIQSQEHPDSTNYLDLEALLIESLGVKAANVHIGRSRQDLHGITRRMIVRDDVLQLIGSVVKTRDALRERARQSSTAVVPAYTHGVPSQPTTFGHLMLAFDSAVSRDIDRLQEAYRRLQTSQLGVAAGSGSAFKLDRAQLARLLGFDTSVANTYDGNFMSTTDYKLEVANVIEQGMLTITKYLANVHAQQRNPRPWLFLDPSVTSGSSIMPQKRNPRPLDRLRTKVAKVIALANEQVLLNLNLDTGMHDVRQIATMVELLKLARDVYEDFVVLISHTHVDAEAALTELNRGYSVATEIADMLYREAGIPFRAAHRFAAQLTELARSSGRSFHELSDAEIEATYQDLLDDAVGLPTSRIRKAFDPVHFVEVRSGAGAPAPVAVHDSLISSEEGVTLQARWLASEREHLNERRFYLREALQRLAR